MARILLLAGHERASRKLEELLVASRHACQATKSVEATARCWPEFAPELLLVDRPAAGLCLHRLERRLPEQLVDWPTQPVLFLRQPEAPVEDHLHESSNLVVPLARPYDDLRLLALVDALVTLRQLLRSDPEGPLSLALPAPAALPEFAQSMLRIVDQRDSSESGHSQRVATLARRLGEHLKLGMDELNCLETAGWHHDLGKLSVAPAILRKPARLNEVERDLLREHPIRGAMLLTALGGSDQAVELVRHHHEHVDGSGTLGRDTTELSIAARILAVAEAFDALSHRQAYRAAFSPSEALAMIRAEAGAKWDQEVVRTLEAVLTEQPTPNSGRGLLTF